MDPLGLDPDRVSAVTVRDEIAEQPEVATRLLAAEPPNRSRHRRLAARAHVPARRHRSPRHLSKPPGKTSLDTCRFQSR